MRLRSIKLSTLLLAPLVFLAIASGTSTFAQSNDNATQSKQNALDKPLKVTKRPRATPRDCGDILSGRTIAKVTFDRSAKVTDVVLIIRSGCRQFDESAVDAAKRIKFEPAVKNGEPITVVKRMEYGFSR